MSTDEEFLEQAKAHGGFAYPASAPMPSGGEYRSCGMTLRDWLAGQYMSGALAAGPGPHLRADILAKDAYAYADSMIVERGL